MTTSNHVSPHEIRARFAQAMSSMYRQEVPQYGTLLKLVEKINASVLEADGDLAQRLQATNQLARLDEERHGAIRLGTAAELATIGRLFSLMGMFPVGYYDLSPAGVPVHATAFRPITASALQRNSFRVFTSLLRLELVNDRGLRERAGRILQTREIFTVRVLELIEQAEREGGLNSHDADEFIAEALETFRWHGESTVDITTYQELRASHPLIADVVCFKGPHINHLTPRVLDIDKAQAAMCQHGMRAKASIEGPPYRRVPILLRQTSFLALEEPVYFQGGDGAEGFHTARFGEIEQRGCALTRKGRDLYDELLLAGTATSLEDAFSAFPDDVNVLREQGLAFFNYYVDRTQQSSTPITDLKQAISSEYIKAEPIVYEDFLPVSAAGIFRSNLGSENRENFLAGPDKSGFERALGRQAMDEFSLYEAQERASIERCMKQLGMPEVKA